jgi:hypothetical protein
MVTPRMGQKPVDGQQWAADNGRYASPQDYTDDGFLSWLTGPMAPYRDRCLFAVAPDTFGDAVATLADSVPLLPRIRQAGYQAALVAQPRMTIDMVRWDLVDVLFVGGPDWWQHSEALVALVTHAKALGRWVHMGRVNGLKRLMYATSIGCDSTDGTHLKFHPGNRAHIDRWLAHAQANPTLLGGIR